MNLLIIITTFLFLILIIVNSLGVIAATKQFAYNLSLMEREQAINAVFNFLNAKGLLDDKMSVKHYVNYYLNGQITSLTQYDKFILKLVHHKLFFRFGLALNIWLILLLFYRCLLHEHKEKPAISGIY